MKQLIIKCVAVLAFTASVGVASAQNKTEVKSFKHLGKEGSAKMHEDYPKVSKVEFQSVKTEAERFAKVDKEWHDVWHAFIEYYHSKGFKEQGKRKLFVHLHFGADGNLDFFGYHFMGKENDYTKQFIGHFQDFVKTYPFNLKEGVRFSQCGMLHIVPKTGLKEGA